LVDYLLFIPFSTSKTDWIFRAIKKIGNQKLKGSDLEKLETT
jgi:hypothetical protein